MSANWMDPYTKQSSSEQRNKVMEYAPITGKTTGALLKFSKIIGDRLSGKVTFVIYCITYNYVMCGHFLNGNIYNI